MRLRQQLLFSDPQPLVERLGRDFFRALPVCPGVYLMRGAGDAVLYVGKAKNLRRRLGSYRVANPERMARRTLRLLRLVERIEWQLCSDEAAALKREAELLRALRPRFNRAGVWPGPPRCLLWRAQREGLVLAVAEKPDPAWNWIGPVGRQAGYLQAALARLLWPKLHPEQGLRNLPAGWFRGRHAANVLIECEIRIAEEISNLLCFFETGNLEIFQSWLPILSSSFEQQAQAEDLASISKFLALRQAKAPKEPKSFC